MIGLGSDKNYHISDSHRLEHREPQGQLKRTISRRHSPPYKGKGVKDIQFWCIKWARGVHKKHLLRLANFFRMNPIMNIGQKWSAWPCLQFGMPKLSVGLAIGLRLRQGGRTWQPFVGSKNGNANFRQARIYNFCIKCGVFAHNRKFAKLTQ